MGYDKQDFMVYVAAILIVLFIIADVMVHCTGCVPTLSMRIRSFNSQSIWCGLFTLVVITFLTTWFIYHIFIEK